MSSLPYSLERVVVSAAPATHDDASLLQLPPSNIIGMVEDDIGDEQVAVPDVLDPNSFLVQSSDDEEVEVDDDEGCIQVNEAPCSVKVEDGGQEDSIMREALPPASTIKLKHKSRRSSRPTRPADLREGARVRVHWPKYGTTFDGVVTEEIIAIGDNSRNAPSSSFSVEYDDGVRTVARAS